MNELEDYQLEILITLVTKQISTIDSLDGFVSEDNQSKNEVVRKHLKRILIKLQKQKFNV